MLADIDFEKIWDVKGILSGCFEHCDGRCEYEALSIFLPGEAEFIAKKSGIAFNEFKENYLSAIKYHDLVDNKDYIIYVYKLGICLFLENGKGCRDETKKNFICKTYPIKGELITGKLKIYPDPWCLLCKKNKLPEDFKNQMTALWEDIGKKLPEWWLRGIMIIDRAYDYSKLNKLRDKEVVTTDELLKCRN